MWFTFETIIQLHTIFYCQVSLTTKLIQIKKQSYIIQNLNNIILSNTSISNRKARKTSWLCKSFEFNVTMSQNKTVRFIRLQNRSCIPVFERLKRKQDAICKGGQGGLNVLRILFNVYILFLGSRQFINDAYP